MQRRHFLSTSLASTCATLMGTGIMAPAVHAQPQTSLKFTLDFRITSQTSPFFLAQAKGYYKDEGLQVDIDVGSGSVASIMRVASGVAMRAAASSPGRRSARRGTRCAERSALRVTDKRESPSRHSMVASASSHAAAQRA